MKAPAVHAAVDRLLVKLDEHPDHPVVLSVIGGESPDPAELIDTAKGLVVLARGDAIVRLMHFLTQGGIDDASLGADPTEPT